MDPVTASRNLQLYYLNTVPSLLAFTPVVIALVLGACGPPVPAMKLRSSPLAIVDGSRTRAYPDIVGVVPTIPRSGGRCTGTVIGDYAILTARHCVQPETGEDSLALGGFTVIFAHDLSDPRGFQNPENLRRVERISEVRTTPGTKLTAGNDLAVLITRSKLTGVRPRALATTTPELSLSARAVGFGRTIAGAFDQPQLAGEKYEGIVKVVESTAAELTVAAQPSMICAGDSGGPLLDIEGGELWGVASRVIYPPDELPCGPRAVGIYTRVAAHQELINAALAVVPECVPEFEFCGDKVDNDCDGYPDDGCKALGEACMASFECESRRCQHTTCVEEPPSDGGSDSVAADAGTASDSELADAEPAGDAGLDIEIDRDEDASDSSLGQEDPLGPPSGGCNLGALRSTRHTPAIILFFSIVALMLLRRKRTPLLGQRHRQPRGSDYRRRRTKGDCYRS